MAVKPSALILSAVAVAASRFRSAPTTRAPSCASEAAMAPPRPPPAPSTSAILSLIPKSIVTPIIELAGTRQASAVR
ncbi:hypothetical protein G6F59_018562 [Rhizopus arrhizus]|nr:hypothetical protein G6F59_018562 [Rhizopus arrhizus]